MATKHDPLISLGIILLLGIALLIVLSSVCHAAWTPTDYNQFMEVI